MRLSRFLIGVAFAAASAAPHIAQAQYSEDFNAGVVPAGWLNYGSYGVTPGPGGVAYMFGDAGMLSPFFTMPSAGTFSFDANFYYIEGAPYPDMAYIYLAGYSDYSLYAFNSYQPLWYIEGTSGTINYSGPIAAGIYRVAFGSGNTDGPPAYSELVFDNIRAIETSPTPEPASLVLMGTGLLGIVGVARRRRNTA